MTPIELLLSYPQTALNLPNQAIRPQVNPQQQKLIDMAMQISTPLVVGRTMAPELKEAMGMIANRTTRGMRVNMEDYEVFAKTAKEMIGKRKYLNISNQ